MLSTEYLSNIATLIKMTCHYETKLEEQRIKMSITPHFQARTIYNILSSDSKGITKEEIKQLFSNFMLNINEKELDYLFQLYSNDNNHINWEDFYQLICPIDMTLDADYHENLNPQIITDLLQQFQRLIKIEITYFRQAEPIRMVLFEKHKENGRQFCSLVEDHKKNITNQNLVNFMKKQQYIFNNQDLFCFKKRIKCLDDQIPSQQFIKYCPLIPFQVLISRQPDYKLVSIRQPIPDTFKQTDMHVLEIPQIFVSQPLSQHIEQQSSPILIPNYQQIEKTNISNYEFYTGKKVVDSGQSTNLNYRFISPQPARTLDTNRQKYFGQSQSQQQISPYQTLQKEANIQPQNQKNNLEQNTITNTKTIEQHNGDLLDKFLRPSPQKKVEVSNNEAFKIKLPIKEQERPYQIVQTQHLSEIPEKDSDMLQEFLNNEKRLDGSINKSLGASDVRKYRIFDEPIAAGIQSRTLFNNNSIQQNSPYQTIQKNSINENTIQPLEQTNPTKQQVKSKKYVSPSIPKMYQTLN